MRSLHPHVMEAFSAELEKVALSDVGSAAATLGVGGALGGGVLGYKKRRAEGGGVLESLGEGAKDALIGGAAGAAAGAGIGGISRALRGEAPAILHAASPGGEVTPWYKAMDKYIGDFGKRTTHAITGWVPAGTDYQEFVKDVGIGGRGALAPIKEQPGVLAALAHQKKVTEDPSWWDKLTLGGWRAKRGVDQAEAIAEANKELIRHEATSLPGWLRALGDPNKRGPVLRHSIAGQWKGMPAPFKAMTALGVASMIPAVTGNLPEGVGRGEAIGSSVGSLAGMALPLPVPMVGQLAGQSALSNVGKYLGKGVDYMTGSGSRKFHDPTDPTQTTDYQPGPERHLSSSASGLSPYGSGIV